MKKAAILAMAVLLGSLGASATPIYTAWQSLSTGLRATSGANTTLNFNEFNPGIGQTLLQVEFRLSSYGEAGYSVTANAAGTTTFQYNGAMTVILNNPVSGTLITVSPTVTDIQRTLTAKGQTYSTPGFPLRTLNVTTPTSPILASTDAGLLALFTGAGTQAVTTKATVNNQFNNVGDITTSVSTRYNATVQVRYLYDQVSDVPEPGTMAIAGACLLALGSVLRLKKGI